MCDPAAGALKPCSRPPTRARVSAAIRRFHLQDGHHFALGLQTILDRRRRVHCRPAVACAQAQSTIQCIQDKKCRKLIEKIAWKKALQQEGQADSIASRIASQAERPRRPGSGAGPGESQRRLPGQGPRSVGRSPGLSPRGFFDEPGSTISTRLAVRPEPIGRPQRDACPTVPADLSLAMHESAINNLSGDRALRHGAARRHVPVGHRQPPRQAA